MSKPIIDKAEVSIDFPDKFYHGTFGRVSRYEVSADSEGLHIALDRLGPERRHVSFHLQYLLLAGVLDSTAEALRDLGSLPVTQRHALRDSVARLHRTLHEIEC